MSNFLIFCAIICGFSEIFKIYYVLNLYYTLLFYKSIVDVLKFLVDFL